MGKGDKKSRRGKVTNGSYGKTRMRKASEPLYDRVETATEEKKKAPVKKAPEPKAEKPAKAKKVEKTKVADEEAD